MGLIVCHRTEPRNEPVLIPFQDGTRCGTQPDCPAIAENPGWAAADSQSDGVPPRCLKGNGVNKNIMLSDIHGRESKEDQKHQGIQVIRTIRSSNQRSSPDGLIRSACKLFSSCRKMCVLRFGEISWGKGGRRWCNHTLCGTDRDKAWAQQSTTQTYQAFIIKADTCALRMQRGKLCRRGRTEASSAPPVIQYEVTK